MKSVDEIRLLLEKFYDGATSCEEEQLLKDFFAQEVDLPEDLEADRSVFATLSEVEDEAVPAIEIPEDLESEINAIIDREVKKSRPKIQWADWKRFAGIAASVCLIVTVGVFLMKNNQIDDPYLADGAGLSDVYVPKTDDEAMLEASRALLLVSEKLSVANENLEYMSF